MACLCEINFPNVEYLKSSYVNIDGQEKISLKMQAKILILPLGFCSSSLGFVLQWLLLLLAPHRLETN